MLEQIKETPSYEVGVTWGEGYEEYSALLDEEEM
jgi:hypothetical protein